MFTKCFHICKHCVLLNNCDACFAKSYTGERRRNWTGILTNECFVLWCACVNQVPKSGANRSVLPGDDDTKKVSKRVGIAFIVWIAIHITVHTVGLFYSSCQGSVKFFCPVYNCVSVGWFHQRYIKHDARTYFLSCAQQRTVNPWQQLIVYLFIHTTQSKPSYQFARPTNQLTVNSCMWTECLFTTRKLPNHLHPVPRLRMDGAIPPLPHMLTWRAHGDRCLCTTSQCSSWC